MKTRNLFGMLLLLLCMIGFVSCLNEDNQEGRKVTGYEEYTVTVASTKLQGVLSSCGSSFLSDVYAVKKEDSQEWEQLSGVQDFDYEVGYEYKILISETNFLDYNMGEPAWTEYKLLKVLSKEKKDSEELPDNFIPDWFQSVPE